MDTSTDSSSLGASLAGVVAAFGAATGGGGDCFGGLTRVVVIGGVGGAATPTALPLAYRTAKSAIGGAASAYGQAAVGGVLEERARKKELEKQQKLAQQGATTSIVP